ncbi:MAG: type II secretion system protein GspN [Polyangia bacterium]
MLGDTARKLLKIAGYPAFFVVLFLVFLIWTFPLDRFQPLAEHQLGGLLDREVTIGELSLSLGGNVVLSDVRISAAAGEAEESDEVGEGEAGGEAADAGPGEEEDGPRGPAYLVDEIVVDIGLLALLFGELDVEVELDALGGEVELAYSGPLPGEGPGSRMTGPRGRGRSARRPLGPAGLPGAQREARPEEEEEEEENGEDDASLSLSVVLSDLDLRRLHDLRSELPLPISGRVSAELEIESSTALFTDAAGELEITIEKLVVGSEDAQVDVGGMPMTVDPIEVDSTSCLVAFGEGRAEFEDFEMKSDDIDIDVTGTINFRDPLARSRFDVYLKFRFLEGYTSKSEKASMLVDNLASFSSKLRRAKRDDGYFGFRYRGRVGSGRLMASKRFGKDDRSGRRRGARPSARGRGARRRSPDALGRDRADLSGKEAREAASGPADRRPEVREPERERNRDDRPKIDKVELRTPFDRARERARAPAQEPGEEEIPAEEEIPEEELEEGEEALEEGEEPPEEEPAEGEIDEEEIPEEELDEEEIPEEELDEEEYE